MKKIFSFLGMSAICITAFSQLSCNPELWPHIYNPARLQSEKKCMTVKGVVRAVVPEADGGYRIQLKLDPGQPTTLLNEKNISVQNGCLVAEIICAHRPITEPDALKTCGIYESQIKVPTVGDHVQVTGTYVLDSDPAHGWNALYPVSDLVELQRR
jgi:hypothetical protein